MDVLSWLSLVLAFPQVLGVFAGSWLWFVQFLARFRRVSLDAEPAPDLITSKLLNGAAEESPRSQFDSKTPFELYPRLLPIDSSSFCCYSEVWSLPMHSQMFVLFALRCVVWAGVCIATVVWSASVWSWGVSAAFPPTVFSEVGTAVMVALDACAIDGMTHFLSRESVSAEALTHCYRFRVMWGFFNGCACIAFSAGIGAASDLGGLINGRLPFWAPLFIRTLLTLCFHLFLLLASGRCGYSDAPARVFGWPVAIWMVLGAMTVGGAFIANFLVEPESLNTVVWVLGVIVTLQNLMFVCVAYSAIATNAAYWRQTWALSYFPLANAGNVDETKSRGYISLETQDFSVLDSPPPLQLHSLLGSGGFSDVFYGTLHITQKVAVKVLKPDRVNAEGVRSFMHEVEIASMLRHPNIVRCMGASMADYTLVMELCESLSLEDRLSANHINYHSLSLSSTTSNCLPLVLSAASSSASSSSSLRPLPSPHINTTSTTSVISIVFPNSLEHALFIALSVAEGCAYLHQHGVLHRDLKPANVLFDKQHEPKICDFGVAQLLATAKTASKSRFGGTLWYAAPELLTEEGADPHPSSDVYSFGLILWELLTGQLLPQRLNADSKNGINLQVAFSRTQRADISWVVSRLQGLSVQQEVCSLVSDCLELPNRRPDFWHICLRLRGLLSLIKPKSTAA